MWKIRKPSLDKSFSDIQDFEDKKIISGVDKDNLIKLVIDYDRQGGSVNDKQLSTISTEGARSLHAHYPDTYKGKRLYYIKEELMNNVSKCPYCSIGQPSTLDHYMPESKYPAMALCRLNLVPMCWECNHEKSCHLPYKEYIHPYYSLFPNAIFLLAKIQIVANELVVNFLFDETVFQDKSEYQQLVLHWKHLEMDKRLKKSVIDFMRSEVLFDFQNIAQCISSIEIQLNVKEERYGRNDWRSAVLRALLDGLRGPDNETILNALRQSGLDSADCLI